MPDNVYLGLLPRVYVAANLKTGRKTHQDFNQIRETPSLVF